MLAELKFILPEIIILSFVSLILLLELFGFSKSTKNNMAYLLAQTALTAAAVSGLYITGGTGKLLLLKGSYVIDNFSVIVKILFYIVTSVILIYSRKYLILRNSCTCEYLVLILLSLLGMMVLISSK